MTHRILVTLWLRALVCECVWGWRREKAEAENRKPFWPDASLEYNNINMSHLNLMKNRPGSYLIDLSQSFPWW